MENKMVTLEELEKRISVLEEHKATMKLVEELQFVRDAMIAMTAFFHKNTYTTVVDGKEQTVTKWSFDTYKPTIECRDDLEINDVVELLYKVLRSAQEDFKRLIKDNETV